MAKPQVRDNAYFLRRMKTEHPAIYQEHASGSLTARQAIVKAGYQRTPTALVALKREWRKASALERRDFLRWCVGRRTTAVPIVTTAPVAASDHRLLPWAAVRILEIMDRRRLKIGAVMAEMGLNTLDTSLSGATAGGRRIKPTLISSLEKWIIDNQHV